MPFPLLQVQCGGCDEHNNQTWSYLVKGYQKCKIKFTAKDNINYAYLSENLD